MAQAGTAPLCTGRHRDSSCRQGQAQGQLLWERAGTGTAPVGKGRHRQSSSGQGQAQEQLLWARAGRYKVGECVLGQEVQNPAQGPSRDHSGGLDERSRIGSRWPRQEQGRQG